jgi:hypothetical protein
MNYTDIDRRIQELLLKIDTLVDTEGLTVDYGGTVQESFRHPELDEMMRSPSWKYIKKALTPEHRRCIRYYKSYLAGECSGMHQTWIEGINQAIAHLQRELEKQKNQRIVIYDQINNRYWAGLHAGIWAKTKARALLFTEAERDTAEKYCRVTNKSVGKRQLMTVTFDASKRLAKESQ